MSKKKFLAVAAVIAVCIMGLMSGSKSRSSQAQETKPPPQMLSISKGYDNHCVRPGWGDPLVHAMSATGWGFTEQQIEMANKIGDWMAKDPDFCQMAEAAIDRAIKTGRWFQMGEYPGQ